MHQVAFEELAGTSLPKEKALHPCLAVGRAARALVEANDRLLRRQKRAEDCFYPKFFGYVVRC